MLTVSGATWDDPPAANRMAREAASLQNQGKFGLAAEVWDEFLTKFPETSLAGKARYYSGVCHMKVGELDPAIDSFEILAGQIKDQPDYPYNEDTLLNLGGCYLSRAEQPGGDSSKDFGLAQKTFGRLAKEFPESKYRDQAIYFQAEAFYLSDNVEASIPLYREVVDDYEDSSVRSNALYALGVALDDAGQSELALKRYEMFLADYERDPLVGDVSMRRAETLLQRSQSLERRGEATEETWEVARAAFDQLSKREGFEQADRATYQAAYCLAKQGKSDLAAPLYASIAERFPKSTYLADARLAAGRAFFQIDNFDKAIQALDPLAKAAGPKQGEAVHWVLQSLLAKNQPQAAYDQAVQVLPKLKDDPFLPYLLMDQGDAAFALGDRRDEARDLYAKIAETYPNHPAAAQALYNAAFEDFEANRTAEAFQLTQQFLEKYADDSFAPDVRALAAECQLRLGRAGDAVAIYKSLLADVKSHPDRERWPLRMALCEFSQKNYAETLAILEPIEGWNRAEWSAEASYLTGACRYYLGDYEKALTSLTAAIDQSSSWGQADVALVLLARTQAKLKQWGAGRMTIEKLLADFPESKQKVEAWFRRGEIEEGDGKPEQAVSWYQRVVDAPGDHALAPYAKIALGWIAFDRNQWDEAQASFSDLIENHSDHQLVAESTLGLGMAQRQNGEHDQAIDTLKQYLNDAEDEASKLNVQFELAMAEMGRKDFAAATKHLEAILAEQPQWDRADQVWYQLAWSAKYQDDQEKADQYFLAMTQQFPRSRLVGEAWFHLGEAAYENQAWSVARQRYAQAIETSAAGVTQNNAQYKLGWTDFKEDKWDEARDRFEALASATEEPMKSQCRYMAAECLFEQKNYAEALTEYQALLPDLLGQEGISGVMKQLASLHAVQAANQAKQHKLALQLGDDFIGKFSNSPSIGEGWFELGKAEQALGKLDSAMDNFEEAALTGADPIAARSRFMIGEIHFSAERFDDAVKQFNRVMFGYGDDPAPGVATWQAVAAFEAARCFHVRIAKAEGDEQAKLVDQAIEHYTYIVDKHPQNRLAAEAKKQTQKLRDFKP